jgi:hypothetical protein
MLSVEGAYTQDSSGALDIQLAQSGTSDALAITDAANIGGNLVVTTASGTDSTTYARGATFTILTAGSVSGQFGNAPGGVQDNGDEADLPQLASGLSWLVDYEPTKVVLEVVGPPTAVVADSVEGSSTTLTVNLAAPLLNATNAEVIWGDEATNWTDNPTDATHNVALAAGATSFTLAHTYADNNPAGAPYEVEVLYNDGDGSFEADTTATVDNVAPTLSNLVISPSSEGSQATLTGTITDPGILDTQTVDVQWGDGSSDSVVNVAAGGTSFSANHTYADNTTGGYTVNVTDTDKDGGVGTDSTTAVVNNVAPVVTLLAVTTSLEGAPSTSPAVLSGSFTDPGTLDTHTVVINWGDGSALTTVYAAAGALSFSGVAHSYPNIGSGQPGSSSGTYPITVTVTDKDGGVGTGGVTAHVNDVPPTLSNVLVSSSNEGSAATLTGIMYDPGPFDTFIMKINWGDGAPLGQTIDYGAGTTSFSVLHVFADNGIYTVNVQLRDNHMTGLDSSPVVANATAVVGNVAPTLSNLSTTTINENGTTTLTGTITDPGVKDTQTLAVDWGDPRSPGDTQTVPYPAANGTQTFTLTHQYLDNPTAGGQYTIGLNITDKDGGTNAYTTPVTVNNVAPSAVSASFSPSTIDGYGYTTLSGTFADPGTLDTHTVVIDWGDGSAPTTLPTLAAGVLSFTSPPHEYANTNPTQTYTATVTVTDKDGAQAQGTANVTVNYNAPVIQGLAVSNATAWDDQYGDNPFGNTDPNPAVLTATLAHFDPSKPVLIIINWGYGGAEGEDNPLWDSFYLPALTGTQTVFQLSRTHDYAGVDGAGADVTPWPVTISASQDVASATGTTSATVNFADPAIRVDGGGSGYSITDVPASGGVPEHWVVLAGVSIIAPSTDTWFALQFNLGGTNDYQQNVTTSGGTEGTFYSDTVTYYSDPTGTLGALTCTITVEIGGGAAITDWTAAQQTTFTLNPAS